MTAKKRNPVVEKLEEIRSYIHNNSNDPLIINGDHLVKHLDQAIAREMKKKDEDQK